jgi:hypothetical protein
MCVYVCTPRSLWMSTYEITSPLNALRPKENLCMYVAVCMSCVCVYVYELRVGECVSVCVCVGVCVCALNVLWQYSYKLYAVLRTDKIAPCCKTLIPMQSDSVATILLHVLEMHTNNLTVTSCSAHKNYARGAKLLYVKQNWVSCHAMHIHLNKKKKKKKPEIKCYVYMWFTEGQYQLTSLFKKKNASTMAILIDFDNTMLKALFRFLFICLYLTNTA